MPDIHQGYGFPVGGLAATELPDGVVSPGGVGYDINCGVRLLALPVSVEELGERREAFVHEISRAIPAGAGKEGGRRVDLEAVLRDGGRVVADREEDVDKTESEGRLDGADPSAVSERAADHLTAIGYQLGLPKRPKGFRHLTPGLHVGERVIPKRPGPKRTHSRTHGR